MRKDAAGETVWDTSSSGERYDESVLDDWLNTTFLPRLDPFVRSLVGTTKFYYTSADTSSYYGAWRVEGEAAVFSLSYGELTSFNEPYSDGPILPTAALLTVPIEKNWWTRSQPANYPSEAWFVRSNGNPGMFGQAEVNQQNWYARPVFTVPSSARVDDNLILTETVNS